MAVAIVSTFLAHRRTMDLFDNRYYKINKMLLRIIGRWPYQSPFEGRVFLTLLLILTGSQLIPQILGFIAVWGDMENFVECMCPFGTAATCATKLINIIYHDEDIKRLVTQMQRDWENVLPGPETEILQRYSERGRKYTMAFTIYLYIAVTVFILGPVLPTFLENSAVNESLSSRLPYIAEYFIDTEKYFYHILVHSYVCSMAFVTIIIANDAMFVVYLVHACGKFAVLGYRLSHMTEYCKFDENDHQSFKTDDQAYRHIANCVAVHKEAIQFADYIETSYSTSLLLEVGQCIVLMSVTGVQVLSNMDDPEKLSAYVSFIMGQLFHLFYSSWPSHEVMDHSTKICDSIYDGEWHRISIRARKLLTLMMMRSLVPCKITAGKLYLMSMENFCSVLSTSMSYFTVLTSMQS
uniref:Odorant receptor n=1 Tax=Sirex nitobei TaxID=1602346 RepID=A0A857N980_9HYME|nr:odorant receptor 18 [Sirex nitobei]